MKNNKLTLKTLQLEIDKLQQKIKTSKVVNATPQGNQDIKHSYIQNLHMKSSMFMLWLATAVLSYGSRIPYIKQIISFLSIMYGRTTIWKVLVKLRKAFILFNAIIGVFMVYKTVGFSYENILAGFAGMGHSYLEIFTNFTRRLFNWFVELFDHKVIPNVPGESGVNLSRKFLSSGPIDKSAFNPQYPISGVEDSLRKSYNSLLNIQVDPVSTPWYKNYSTWLWIIGGISVVYFGYKFIVDPLFIQELGSGTSTARQSPIDGPSSSGPSSEITITDNRTMSDVIKPLGKIIGKIKTNLNPLNWILSTQDTAQGFKVFMERQNVMETANRKLYPFTTVNPYLPWYEQLKIYLVGESVIENLKRFKAMEYADRVVKRLEVSKGKYPDLRGVSPALTPNMWAETAASTNFSTPVPRVAFVEALESYNTQSKLNMLPPTPTMNPGLMDVGGWKTHDKLPFTTDTDKWLNTWKGGQVASSSKMVTETLSVD